MVFSGGVWIGIVGVMWGYLGVGIGVCWGLCWCGCVVVGVCGIVFGWLIWNLDGGSVGGVVWYLGVVFWFGLW